jgi:hypothetical protein
MNFKKFLIFTFLQAVLLTVIKIYFFKNTDFSLTNQTYLFLGVIAVVVSVLIRIIGVMNFFEAFYITAIWIVLDGFLDLVITTQFLGYDIYFTKELWLGYLVTGLCIVCFHEKYHIHIRKKLHSHHH